jgi:hypothetical protein
MILNRRLIPDGENSSAFHHSISPKMSKRLGYRGVENIYEYVIHHKEIAMRITSTLSYICLYPQGGFTRPLTAILR